MSNPVRDAIGVALDHPFAEEAFRLVDRIESDVRETGIPGEEGESHEAASEMTDSILDALSTRDLATLWVVLSANDEGGDLYAGAESSTLHRLRCDVYVVVERAVHAAIQAYAESTAAILTGAEEAYDRQDQAWFDAQSTEDLAMLWAIACDIERGGAWDDEVYEALAKRGHFDAKDES